MEWDDAQLTAPDIEWRLEVVEAVLWASEHPDDVLAVVTSAPTLQESIRRFMATPYMLTEMQAQHVLDTPVRRFSPESVAALRDEADRFRRRLESLPTTP